MATTYPTAEQEIAASKALWEAKEARDAATLQEVLSDLETAVDSVDYDSLDDAVRKEVELRHFEIKRKSYYANSEESVQGSSIDGGVEGGSGS